MIISAGYSKNNKDTRVERPTGFPYWSCGFFLTGTTELRTPSRTFKMSHNTFMLIPPNNAYSLNFLTSEQETWCLFEPRPEILPFLQPKDKSAQFSPVILNGSKRSSEIKDAMRDLVQRWEQNPPHVMLAENALERALLLAHELMAQHGPSPLDDRIKKSVNFILQHYTEPITVPDAARNAVMSPSRFAHLFREQVGMAPMCFLEHRRMEKARQLLLSTRMNVKEIAFQVGFTNEFHFSTRFRKLTGQSPRIYRQRPQRRWQSLSAF